MATAAPAGAAETQPRAFSLEVRRTIRAPRQRVFDAWTKADQIRAFHAPGPMTVSHIDVDLRVGGAFSLHMRRPDGAENRAFGVYTEIDPPKKVAYTWNWEGMPGLDETLITVDFLDLGDATEVVLHHSGLPSEEQCARHTEGWSGILDKLCEHFGSPASGKTYEGCTA